MNRLLSRLLTDYGMILVLAILCAFFSVATLSEQAPTGEAAAREVAMALGTKFRKSPRVMIVARDQVEDAVFASKLEEALAATEAKVIAIVKGEPKDARAALQRSFV